MEKKYMMYVDRAILEEIEGVICESVKAYAEIDSELVKKVVSMSDRNVYFLVHNDEISIDYHNNFYDVKEVLKKEIESSVIRKIKDRKYERDGCVLYISEKIKDKDIDMKKVKEEIRRVRERMREREKMSEKSKKIVSEITDYLDKNKDKYRYEIHDVYSKVYKKIDVRVIVNNEVIDEFSVYTNDESAITKVKEYHYAEAVSKYIQRLKDEIKELKEEVQRTKEEIVKEMYENDEEIEIETETTITLKVVADEDY